MQTLSDDFKGAWLTLTGEDFATRLARESLETSTVGVCELEQTLAALQPDR